MVCAGARCLCKRSSFEASCVPCWFIVYIVLPSNLYFYKYPSINDSGYLLSPCVHWCWYTCAFSIAPIRLDLDAFFVLYFWLCSVLYNLLCCLHIGNGLIIQILRHRDLNYTGRSFWADQAEPNSSRVFGADQVDAISIQDVGCISLWLVQAPVFMQCQMISILLIWWKFTRRVMMKNMNICYVQTSYIMLF